MNTTNKNLSLIALILMLGFAGTLIAAPHGANILTGKLLYASNTPTGMKNSTITLTNLSGSIISQTSTDASGSYTFTGIPDGNYIINPSTSIPWGGVNSTDALGMSLQFVNLIHLTGIRLQAGDVYKNDMVNAMDAQAAMRRFVGIDASFSTRPDFYFETPQVSLTGGITLYQDLNAICYGDVDGSYNVSSIIRMTPSLEVKSLNSMNIQTGETIDIPVTLNQNADLGAISLSLNYPSKDLEILGISMAKGNGTLLYNAADGNLRISWISTEPLTINSGAPVLYIHAKITGTSSISFTQADGCEVADATGNVIAQSSMNIPELKNTVLSSNIETILNVSPNPVISNTRVTFTSQKEQLASIQIVNLMGQLVYEENLELTAGDNSHYINMVNLPKGMYILELWAGSTKIDKKKIIKN